MVSGKPRYEKFFCDVCGKEMRFDLIKTRRVKVPGLEIDGGPVWKKYFTCTRQKCKKEYTIYYETTEILELMQKQQEQRQKLSQIPLQGAGMTRETIMHDMDRRKQTLTQKLAEARTVAESRG